jgi:hypothetical protein
MFHCEAHSVRTHDLLEVDAKQLITAHATIPRWAAQNSDRCSWMRKESAMGLVL